MSEGEWIKDIYMCVWGKWKYKYMRDEWIYEGWEGGIYEGEYEREWSRVKEVKRKSEWEYECKGDIWMNEWMRDGEWKYKECEGSRVNEYECGYVNIKINMWGI